MINLKKININQIVKNFIIIVVTAIPGVQKLLILAIISFFYSVTDLADYINDSFIVVMLSYFTAIGWSSVLIADINKYHQNFRKKFYGFILANTFLYLTAFFVVVLILFISGWIQNLFGAFWFLVSYTFYQLWRNYELSKHAYNTILFYDLSILFLFSLFLFGFSKMGLDPIWAVSIVFAIPFVATNLKEKISFIPSFKNNNKILKSFHYRAFYTGISNFATASPSLFIAPFSYKLLSPEYTTVIGFLSNIVNIIFLLPRAFSLYNLPLLSKIHNNKSKLKKEYKKYARSIYMLLGLLLFMSLVFIVIYMIFESKFEFLQIYRLPHIYTISIIMISFGIASQTLLPVSNLSVILRKEKIVTKINLLSLSVFVIAYFLLYMIVEKDVIAVIYYQILLFFTIVFRFYKINQNVKI